MFARLLLLFRLTLPDLRLKADAAVIEQAENQTGLVLWDSLQMKCLSDAAFVLVIDLQLPDECVCQRLHRAAQIADVVHVTVFVNVGRRDSVDAGILQLWPWQTPQAR